MFHQGSLLFTLIEACAVVTVCDACQLNLHVVLLCVFPVMFYLLLAATVTTSTKMFAVLQLLSMMSKLNESSDREDGFHPLLSTDYFLSLEEHYFNSQVSCCDSLWCIFPAGRERGRSLCEPCRSSPPPSRALPSVHTSPWWSSSPLPSSPSSEFCHFSQLRKRMTQFSTRSSSLVDFNFSNNDKQHQTESTKVCEQGLPHTVIMAM